MIVRGSALAWLACGLLGPMGAAGQQAGSPEPVRLETIPANFELWQDAQGFLWQLSRQGTLGSAEASYFQAAMALFVKGEAFTPVDGVRPDGGSATEAGATVILGQTMGGMKVAREFWFDRERAGVRVLDTFENTGARRESIRVELRTSFQNPWQDLHGTSGRILGADSDDGLGDRDFGAVVKFSPAEGRHDTLFVACGERDAARPAVSYSSNLREVTFAYDLDIEPGQRASLLHWIVQRNLQTPPDAVEALRPFYQRRQLIDPRVPEALVAGVRNFDKPSFPAAGERSAALEALVSLNAAIEPLGLARRADDLLWITADNQLSGTANPAATLTVKTQIGERKAGLGEVAAIQGGADVGRVPRVFLRDGRVWAGEIVAEQLSMKTAEGWEVEEMKPAEISLLLLRVGKTDGVAHEKAGLMLELRSGDVLSVDAESARSTRLALATPWGETGAALGEIRALAYLSGQSMAPRYRVWRSDGALLTAFLGGEPLSLQESGGGEAVKVAPNGIAAAWLPGGALAAVSGDLADEWYEWDDVRAALGPDALPEAAVLLAGNNVLPGEWVDGTLNLVTGAAVTPIAAAEIVAMRRSIDSDSDTEPLFEVELSGGEVLTGRWREPVLAFRSADREWRVPVSQVMASRRAGTPAAETKSQ